MIIIIALRIYNELPRFGYIHSNLLEVLYHFICLTRNWNYVIIIIIIIFYFARIFLEIRLVFFDNNINRSFCLIYLKNEFETDSCACDCGGPDCDCEFALDCCCDCWPDCDCDCDWFGFCCCCCWDPVSMHRRRKIFISIL